MRELNKETQPEVAIRTMDSDMKTFEQSGGEMAMAQAVSLPESEPESKFEISGYTGPEKPIFNPAPAPAIAGPAKWRPIAVFIGILAIIIIFGFLGYFVISPWLFPNKMPIVQ